MFMFNRRHTHTRTRVIGKEEKHTNVNVMGATVNGRWSDIAAVNSVGTTGHHHHNPGMIGPIIHATN